MNVRSLMLAGAASLLLAVPALASAPNGLTGSTTAKATNVQYAAVQCMTDDGYGRKRPCSALYKKENPNWKSSDNCMTDDGHGRYRPCSALYKQKHSPKQ
jgi:hypothetical protein